MALHLNFDHNSRSYLTVTCDGCSARFLCYDDACYNFTSLRTEAVFAGWDVRPRPEQPDYCPSCVRQRNTSTRTGSPRRVAAELEKTARSSDYNNPKQATEAPVGTPAPIWHPLCHP
jgi:hypothetical protein